MSNIDFVRKAAQIARGGGHIEIEKRQYRALKKRLRKLPLKLGEPTASGTNVKIYKDKRLYELYGRPNLCLKVFWRSRTIWGYEGAGGISSILESTIAQNLLAMKGYAGRVYDLVDVEGKTAQVLDFVEGKEGAREIVDDRFSFYKDDLARDHNWRGGKLIDFQGTKIKDEREYKRGLIERIAKANGDHGHTYNIYQSTEYQPGLRDTKERLARYKFQNMAKMTILDIGCSNGMMCRAVSDAGAKRVVGIDWPDMAELAQELAILDGYFNLDFYGADIKKLSWERLVKMTGIKKFDVFLFLAMITHVGAPEWLRKCDTLYIEGHGVKRNFKIINFKENRNAEITI